MKNMLLLLFTLGMASAHGQKGGYISGRVTGYYARELRFCTLNNYIESKPRVLSQVSTDDQGRFTTEIALPGAQPVVIFYGNGIQMTLWIEQNDSIIMDVIKPANIVSLNSETKLDKGRVIFSGRGANINSFLFAADLSVYDPQTHQAAQRLSVEEYIAFLDSLENTRLLLRKKEFSEKFSLAAEEFISGEMVYSTFYHKSMAEVYRSKKDRQDSLLLTTPEFYSYWKRWTFPSDLALSSPGYRNSLLTYFNRKAREQIGRPVSDRDKERYFSIAYDQADRELPYHSLTKEYIQAFLLYHMFSFVQSNDSVIIRTARFHKNFPHSAYYPILEKKLSFKKVNKQSSEITALDTNGYLINLNALKGKIVYVDIWASWCGPCVKEFYNSKKLAEKFKDRIHFVYLNIDDTEEAWRRVIGVQGLKGLHLRADERTSKKIRSLYNISSIPRYLLIDQKGFVVSENAKRPSETEQDVLHLLKQ